MTGLDPLYKRRVFHSDIRADTHDLVSNELADHHLRWHQGATDTQMFKIQSERLALYSLRYGSEVEVFPQVYEGFSLVHYALRGDIEVTADGQTSIVRPGRALLSSPHRNIRLRWSEDCEQLILRVPHSLLKNALSRMGQSDDSQGLRHRPGLLLDATNSKVWRSQMNSYVLGNSLAGDAGIATWMGHLEDGLGLFLATNLSERASSIPDAAVPLADAYSMRRRERLRDFALQNLHRPLSADDLAQAAALSVRQLNSFCHKHFDQSPMIWLRGLRLDAIRSALLNDPSCRVTDLAFRYGFFHLGRLPAVYRERFGELPSQTGQTAGNG